MKKKAKSLSNIYLPVNTNMSQNGDPCFQYFLADKKPILVITLVGRLNFVAVQALLNCKADINKLSANSGVKFVVFYCRDVEAVTGDAIGVFTQIQIEIRARSWDLNICSLRPEIKEKLINMGVVRKSELSDNMREALLAFVPATAGGTKLRAA